MTSRIKSNIHYMSFEDHKQLSLNQPSNLDVSDICSLLAWNQDVTFTDLEVQLAYEVICQVCESLKDIPFVTEDMLISHTNVKPAFARRLCSVLIPCLQWQPLFHDVENKLKCSEALREMSSALSGRIFKLRYVPNGELDIYGHESHFKSLFATCVDLHRLAMTPRARERISSTMKILVFLISCSNGNSISKDELASIVFDARIVFHPTATT